IMPDVRLRLSSLLMVRDAVCAGAGAALLPRGVVADAAAEGRLVIWSTVPHRTSELWVLHSSRRLVSTKVSAFVDFVVEALRGTHGIGAGRRLVSGTGASAARARRAGHVGGGGSTARRGARSTPRARASPILFQPPLDIERAVER